MGNKQETSHWHFTIGIPAIIWQVLFLYIPLFFVVITSFLRYSSDGRIMGLTLSNLTQFFTPSYLKIIAGSLALAFSNGIICLAIALPIAYYMQFPGRKHKMLLLFFLMIPFWTNFLLLVYAWFYVLENYGVINALLLKLGLISTPLKLLYNLPAIILMMVYVYVPFAILPLYSSLENFDTRLLEASSNLGATWWQTKKKVLIPLIGKGIRAGFFLVFIPSFGEFAIPELMGGDKTYFVGNVVSFYILGDQNRGRGEAFTFFSMLILTIVSIVLFCLSKKLIKDGKTYE